MLQIRGASRVAKFIQQAFLPDYSQIRGAVLCKNNPVHFIQGILVSNTGYKQRYDVWSIISPLWIGDISVPKLNYSTRLNDGKTFNGSEKVVAELLIENIRNNQAFIKQLFNPEISVSSFLENCFVNIDLSIAQQANALFDFGVSLLIIGDLPEGNARLRQLLRHFTSPTDSELYIDTKRIIESLEKNDGRYLSIIKDLENRGRFRLGIQQAL